jgi:hypothetical protein
MVRTQRVVQLRLTFSPLVAQPFWCVSGYPVTDFSLVVFGERSRSGALDGTAGEWPWEKFVWLTDSEKIISNRVDKTKTGCMICPPRTGLVKEKRSVGCTKVLAIE